MQINILNKVEYIGKLHNLAPKWYLFRHEMHET